MWQLPNHSVIYLLAILRTTVLHHYRQNILVRKCKEGPRGQAFPLLKKLKLAKLY